MTNTEIRVELETKGWFQRTITKVIETLQQKSFWFHSDPTKLLIHLLLVEDLTEALTPPKLFIYSDRDRWIPINVGDLV